jgi:rSAM/selenodomain-associated transferase 2
MKRTTLKIYCARWTPEKTSRLFWLTEASIDETRDIAQKNGARIVVSHKGRATQNNEGAGVASGDILLFLHADTQLPVGFDTHIRQAFTDPNIAAGAFLLHINSDTPGIRTIEWLTNWRSTIFGLPYGDQAIFVREEVFEGLGGFPVMPIMEDFAFMRMLRKNHHKITILPSAVTTSARRWEKLGVFKTTLINQLIIFAYYLGVSPEKLATWYRKRR